MSAHRKQHGPLSSADHSLLGTDDTVLAQEGSTLVAKAFSQTAVADKLVEYGTGGHIAVPTTGATGGQAMSQTQTQAAIDAAVEGLKVKAPVQVMNVIDDSLNTPPGGDSAGDAYIVGATPAGVWSGFSTGDLVQYDGASWNLVLAGTGSAPAANARVTVTGLGSGTAAGSFAGQADKIGAYSGGWTFEAPVDGWGVLVIGENGINENKRYIYDASPAGWVEFAGAIPSHNSTTGIQGGSAAERYHLTSAEHTLSLDHKAEITLAGTEPVLSDLTSLAADGDWAFAKGTGDEAYVCVRIGTKKYAVEASEITA